MADELKDVCVRHREIARQHPVNSPLLHRAKQNPRHLARYTFRIGKFLVSITYETHCQPPRWHAHATILEDVGELEFGAAQEAMLALQSWTPEDHAQAHAILGECLAPEILRHTQPVTVHEGLWSVHWLTNTEASNGRRDDSRIILATH
jgi:hypothetical protein